MPSPAPTSRERLLAAASREFAASGFEGARVDRITRQARVNKAMLYYHFDDKAALYREILRDLFESVARRLGDARAAGRTPAEQLRAFIRIIADETEARPHFPQVWLREMAESGRHLDASVISAIKAILGILSGILEDGEKAGAFRRVPPMVVQMSLVAPLLLFAASASSRERFSRQLAPDVSRVPREALVEYLEIAALAALRPVEAAPRARRRR